jgi:hypothetical protein
MSKRPVALVFASAMLFTSAQAFAVDLSGVWKIDGTVGENPVSATCTFKQTDTHITGTCKMPQSDTALDVTGEASDTKVTWKYSLDYQGDTYTLTYTGTPDSNATSIKGSIMVVPSDTEGDFTAQKQ